MIARHSAAAISGLLVWWLVVENLIVALAPARIARFLPFVAGNAMVGIEMDSPDPTLPASSSPAPRTQCSGRLRHAGARRRSRGAPPAGSTMTSGRSAVWGRPVA